MHTTKKEILTSIKLYFKYKNLVKSYLSSYKFLKKFSNNKTPFMSSGMNE